MILDKCKMESKKYVVVKNHVREIVAKHESEDSSKTEASIHVDEEKSKQEQTSADQDKDINEKDLQELLSAYNNCKAIISKIETKYGHLLNLNCNENENSRKRKYRYNQCNCVSNKKFIFDDNGEVLDYHDVPISHVCGYKQSSYNDFSHYNEYSPYNYYKGRLHVQVENDTSFQLPKTICELGELLKDPSLHKSLRYRVIQQIKYIRHQNLSTIKYDKRYMVQQLKLNPDEYFNFKGSNLSSLEGYPE